MLCLWLYHDKNKKHKNAGIRVLFKWKNGNDDIIAMDGHWDAHMFNYEKFSSVLVHGTCYHSNTMAFFNVLLADAVPDHEV